MGGEAIQTKCEREMYVLTNFPRVLYLYVYSQQDLKYIGEYIHCTETVLLLKLDKGFLISTDT